MPQALERRRDGLGKFSSILRKFADARGESWGTDIPRFHLWEYVTYSDDELAAQIADAPAPFWRHVRDASGLGPAPAAERRRPSVTRVGAQRCPPRMFLRSRDHGRLDEPIEGRWPLLLSSQRAVARREDGYPDDTAAASARAAARSRDRTSVFRDSSWFFQRSVKPCRAGLQGGGDPALPPARPPAPLRVREDCRGRPGHATGRAARTREELAHARRVRPRSHALELRRGVALVWPRASLVALEAAWLCK